MSKKFKTTLKTIIVIILLTITCSYSFIFNRLALADTKIKGINNCYNGCLCDCSCCLDEGVLTEIHFIDVGNADSIFIKGEKNILIDGGEDKQRMRF